MCPQTSAGIFGQRLEDSVHHECKYGPRLAPLLVEQCVDFIWEHGLTEEGLFRMPGQTLLVRDLQDSFHCREKPLFDRGQGGPGSGSRTPVAARLLLLMRTSVLVTAVPWFRPTSTCSSLQQRKGRQ
ncbi:Rho GTPase activating protein 24 isoform 1 isoform 3-like protein [Camelus ferus]|nr:Rho GTPase activating protein 24 isoform 1 isoform 3-like protein [Camelus ferus]